MDMTLPTDTWAGRQWTEPKGLTKGDRVTLWVIGFSVGAAVVAVALGQL
jgi:hypothetical protein